MGKYYANGAKLHRWSAEYLSSLQPRKKWLSEQDSLQIDDVVYFTNEITPPRKWPLSQVTVLHLYLGKYDKVRVVELNTVAYQ